MRNFAVDFQPKKLSIYIYQQKNMKKINAILGALCVVATAFAAQVSPVQALRFAPSFEPAVIDADAATIKANADVVATDAKSFTTAKAELVDSTATQGYWQIFAQSNDTVVVLSAIAKQVAGTYAISDLYADYTYLGIYDSSTKKITGKISFASGSLTIKEANDGSYAVSGTLVGSDNIEYTLSITITPADPYEYDEESGDVNKTFSSSATQQSQSYNQGGVYMLALGITDNSASTVLYFITSSVDGTIFVPAGTYTIDDSYATGTVIASEGLSNNYLMPSYYCTISKGYADKAYFLVSGTVTVENSNGNLKLTVDAENSKGVKVHIDYNAPYTDLINTKSTLNGVKTLGADGVLYIQTEKNTYNAQGAIVK